MCAKPSRKPPSEVLACLNVSCTSRQSPRNNKSAYNSLPQALFGALYGDGLLPKVAYTPSRLLNVDQDFYSNYQTTSISMDARAYLYAPKRCSSHTGWPTAQHVFRDSPTASVVQPCLAILKHAKDL